MHQPVIDGWLGSQGLHHIVTAHMIKIMKGCQYWERMRTRKPVEILQFRTTVCASPVSRATLFVITRMCWYFLSISFTPAGSSVAK
jgi:hypothetical protein